MSDEWKAPPSRLSQLTSKFKTYIKEHMKKPTLGPNHEKAGSFAVLPPEIIGDIAFFLDTVSNNAFRRTCKYSEACTWHHWQRTCLQCIRSDFSAKSYGSLVKLAQQPRLAEQVQKLVVSERSFDAGLGSGFSWQRHHDTRIICSQVNVRTFMRLLTNFPNLSAIRISRPFTAWDLDRFDNLTASDVVTIMVAIIAGSRLPLSSFEIDFEPLPRNPIDLSRIHRNDFLDPAFLLAWNRLEKLAIRVQIMDGIGLGFHYLLLHNCPNLKSLSLDLERGTFGWGLIRILANNQHGATHRLEELSLRGVEIVSLSHLRKTIHRHRRTLRKLSLFAVTLPKSGHWRWLFNILRETCPVLESIEFNDIREIGDVARRLIHFPEVSTTSVKEADGVQFVYHARRWPQGDRRAPMYNFFISYQGPKMESALRLLDKWAAAISIGP
ncbi:hypothetical protein BJX64DRAFT_289083 [Aspergillus heterothallicus]